MVTKGQARAEPVYWRSGVIRKVCVSPKAAETRALVLWTLQEYFYLLDNGKKKQEEERK